MKMECQMHELEMDRLSLVGDEKIRELIYQKRKLKASRRQFMKLLSAVQPRLAGIVDGLQIEQYLGTGRFGSVHNGLKLEFNHKIAIKEYHEMFNETIKEALELQSMIRQLIYLRHPFIVKTFLVSQNANIFYSVMERAQHSIQEEIMKNGELDEERAKKVIWQVIRAVEFLHSQDIIHGSVHNKNILIFNNDTIKVTDHVTSRLIHQLPHFETPFGIMRFWAPELINGFPISAKSDVWSIGVALYSMLYGEFPFGGGNRDELQDNIRRGANISPDISDSAMQVLKGMLNGNANRRLTATEVKHCDWLALGDEFMGTMGERHEMLVHNILEKKKQLEETAPIPVPQEEPCAIPDNNNNEEVITVIEDSEESEGEDGGSEPSVEAAAPLPKRYYKKFTVFVVENVREEWDPNVMHLDKCKMKFAGKETPCLRIVLPHIEVPAPSIFKRLKLRVEKALNRLNVDPQEEFDYNHGDYCLMEFTRNQMAIEPYENVIQFPNRRIAGTYYYKEHADRLWNHCGVCVCMNCRRMQTDSENHSNERCLYKIWKEANDSEEILFMGDEDRFHIRSFNMVYRNDGGRQSAMARFRRGSRRIFENGVSRIRNTFPFRRSVQTD